MEKMIKNYDELATTPLRRDALDILETAYEAVNTKNIIKNTLVKSDGTVKIQDVEFKLEDYDRLFFVGIGKCAVDAAAAIEDILGDKITDGVVIDQKAGVFKKIRSFVGTHPYPSEQNVTAAKEVVTMLSKLTDKDLVLTVISGGGSSLLSLPHKISTDMLMLITRTMMDKGAPIRELNIVRKHLSEVQGGQLAKTAYPAKIVSLIFSDVPGNDLATIASGPTVRDESTLHEAEALFVKYDILKECRLVTLEAVETPKEEKYFENVHNLLVLSNDIALAAMKTKATELGYSAEILNDKVQGEARELGKTMAQMPIERKNCFLYGGETTVTVIRQNGTGGRNQELVLGALPSIKDNVVVVAAGSDGWDNSDTAGAIGDKPLFENAEKFKISAEKFLDDNNSFTFFERVKTASPADDPARAGHIMTGRTGANVADFYFVLMG